MATVSHVHGEVLAAASLAAAVADVSTSEGILCAAERHGWRLVDVLEMDEYTLDWLLAADDAWLVFDTT